MAFLKRNKKILLVEDEAETRDVYQEVLRGAGFQVVLAENGKEGLSKAEEGGFRLILLDIMMPEIDGLEFLRLLKDRKPVKKNGPVVLLTNLAHDPIIKEGLELGAIDSLIKTDFTPDELVEKIKQLTF